MAVAFFDLDRTLLSVNSGELWVRSELRLGFITRWQALKAGLWITGYHLGFAKMEPVLEDAIATLAGVPEAEIRARTERFYAAEVATTYRPGARAAVQAHRDAGDRVVLLTSSSPYLSGPVQAELGLDDVLCNRFEVKDGVFTGRPDGALCYGPGKLVHAQRWCAEHGEALADATFYTDSASDLAVLEAVGTPVVVAPDPQLKRIATKRGWRVEVWAG